MDEEIAIIDKENKELYIESDNIIISTGSEPVPLPGVEFDEEKIISSTGA